MSRTVAESRLGERLEASGIIDGRGGELEQDPHPETRRLRRHAGQLNQFPSQTRAECFKVFLSPLGGHRIRVMKVKGLERTLAQGVEGRVAVKAGHIPGADQRLQCQREQAPHAGIQTTQRIRLR